MILLWRRRWSLIDIGLLFLARLDYGNTLLSIHGANVAASLRFLCSRPLSLRKSFQSVIPHVSSSNGFTDSSTIREGSSIYSAPELYDLAFSYRDFGAEVKFLLQAHAKHAGPGAHTAVSGPDLNFEYPPSISEGGANRRMRVLELAAGPARHCSIAARKYGVGATALDCNKDMLQYAATVSEQEASLNPLHYVHKDMRDFSSADLESAGEATGELSDGLVDSVWCLLGSAGHLLTNEDWLSMLKCASRVLTAGGTLILELPHPRETFRLEDTTMDGWDVPEGDDNPLGIGLSGEDGGILGVQWGNADDHFDPLTQIRQAFVELELERQGKIVQRVREVVPQREIGLQELKLLAHLSGGFDSKVSNKSPLDVQLAVYGAMDLDVPLQHEDDAFRLVAVLTKA